jgi:hypothetical protein
MTGPTARATKRRTKKKSPTERTMESFRKRGYVCGKTERWISQTKQYVDLFGCIDLIAIKPYVVYTSGADHVFARGIIGVQATTGDHHAHRRTKALCEPLLGVWLKSGGRFQIVTWSQRGDRGKKKVWTERVEELTLSDFDAPSAAVQREAAVKARDAQAAVKKRERAAKFAARRAAKLAASNS